MHICISKVSLKTELLLVVQSTSVRKYSSYRHQAHPARPVCPDQDDTDRLVTVEEVISRELFFPRSPRLWGWGQWPRLLPGAAHQADVLFQVAGKEEPTEETCTDGLNPCWTCSSSLDPDPLKKPWF